MAIYAELDDYDDLLGDTTEIPCEFCDLLFPFELVYEHQLACEENTFVGGSDPVDFDRVSTVPLQQREKKVVSEVQTSLNLGQNTEKKTSVNPIRNIDEKKELHQPFNKLTIGQEQKNQRISVNQNNTSNLKPYMAKEHSDSDIIEDPIMQESGTKLMEYGSKKQQDNTETERKTFKIPSILTLNNESSKTLDDSCSSLSDDNDDNESLEEYWKRAEVKNQRRLKMLQNEKTTKFYNHY